VSYTKIQRIKVGVLFYCRELIWQISRKKQLYSTKELDVKR